MEKTEVLIIGGGIVGLLTAYMLNKNYNVILISDGNLKKAASWGNAGLIAPSFGAPMPNIFGFSSLIRIILGLNKVIKLRFVFLLKKFYPDMVMLIKFKDKLVNSLNIIREMALESAKLTEKIIIEEKLDVDFKRTGILEVYINKANFEEDIKEIEKYLGKVNVRSASECIEEEPLLKRNIYGGIFYEDDSWLDPAKLMISLRNLLTRKGIKIVNGNVKSFRTLKDKVISAKLNGEEILADNFVVACGAYTPKLLANINLKIPIFAGRGYTVLTNPILKKLRKPVICGEYRIAISQRVQGNFKISGIFELTKPEDKEDKSLYNLLKEKSSLYIDTISELNLEERWMGSRPCTPDGLPLVGYTTYKNLIIASGHCRLGLTLAAITGKIVKELLEDKESKFFNLLSPSRFKL
ncbi:MAG: FAD-dependent oxidoreductase [Nitrososphaerales archaeon]